MGNTIIPSICVCIAFTFFKCLNAVIIITSYRFCFESMCILYATVRICYTEDYCGNFQKKNASITSLDMFTFKKTKV